ADVADRDKGPAGGVVQRHGGAVIHALRAQDGAGEGVTVREVRQSGRVQARVGAAGEEAAGVMVMAGDAQVTDVRGIRMAEEGDGAHGEAAAVGHRQGRGVAEDAAQGECAHGLTP
ncbi:hypothetical protein, partial [Enterobacter sp. BIDMC 26]|uniref:hypothetical protein n=1 Tax=Enterobacter sp. BIDMC 26 TaxID=1329838 RepID=UPI0015E17783